MADKDNLGMELSKLLFQYEPTLLGGKDMEATARAAAAVANLLGCILAERVLHESDGKGSFEATLQACGDVVRKTAFKVAGNALNQKPATVQ